MEHTICCSNDLSYQFPLAVALYFIILSGRKFLFELVHCYLFWRKRTSHVEVVTLVIQKVEGIQRKK